MNAFDPFLNDFDLFFAKYGIWDYTLWRRVPGYEGYWRYRCYHDGGWLEGYNLEPVIYWGA